MIADLKADSSRWKAEKEQAPSSSKRSKEPGRPNKASGSKASPDMTPESYTSSRTHEHRQAAGPSFPDTPQPTYVEPQQPLYDEPSGRIQPGADMSQQAYDNYYNQQNPANQNGPYNQHMPSYQPVSGATPNSGYPGGTAYPVTDPYPSNPYEFGFPTYLSPQTGREETQPRNPYPGYPPQAGRSGPPNHDPRTGQTLAYPGQAPTQNNPPRYSSRQPERGTDPYDRNDGYTGRGR